jgi:hypothetical protein
MNKNSKTNHAAAIADRSQERGAALATALIVMSLLAAISMTVLAVVTHESRIAGSDLQRTQTFYAAAAAVEKMTSDFCSLYARTSRPTTTDFNNIAAAYPPELVSEGFSFTKPDGTPNQSLIIDPNGATGTVTIPNGAYSGLVASVTPYLLDTTATQTATGAQVELRRKINNYLIPIFQFGMFSNEDLEVHPGPPFAFNGRVHANGNLYISGDMTFLSKVTTANELVVDVLRNGSAHAQSMSVKVGSIDVPLTMGSVTGGPNVSGQTSGMPGYFPGSPSGSFNTTSWISTSVAAASSGVANQFGGQVLTRATGAGPLLLPMQIEGNQVREIIKRMMPNDSQILTQSRYHSKAQIRILIDDEAPTTADAAGIPAGQGVNLSTFDPVPLPNASPVPGPSSNGGGRALWRVNDNNTSVSNSYNETTTTFVNQQQNGTARQADTVRGVRVPVAENITGAALVTISGTTYIQVTCNSHGFANGDLVVISGVQGATNANGEFTVGNVATNTFTLSTPHPTTLPSTYTASTGTVYGLPKSPNGTVIPRGAAITGHILIQIVDSNGVARDVTQQILSMGMTEGEPNAIIMLQRPLWAAFTQGSRDASTASPTPNPALNGDPGYSNTLTDILNKTHVGADGEIKTDATHPVQNSTLGYLTAIVDDTASGVNPVRSDVSMNLNIADWGTSAWNTNGEWNAVVPINVYNIREGRINASLNAATVYERGITSVVDINMRNLARWLDGVYDVNLLQNTGAVSTNIASPDGYTLYVSDRRGDKVKALVDNGVPVNATNGMVDNEDIYGPNNVLDPGEDVQNTGTLVKDITELPDPAALAGSYGTDINKRAITAAAWTNLIGGSGSDKNNSKYFRNSVRLFNGENLQVSGATGKLSTTKGITISTENMVYIWGNYNTTGINNAPPDGTSSLNDNTTTYYYLGNQVPTSIVCDAFFPLSKTFFDSETSLYPDVLGSRPADNSPTVAQETAVRAAIIAGNNLSALSGANPALLAGPDAGNSASGESRLCGGMHNFPRFLESWSARWNFVGSLIPLYHSTQAVGQYNADDGIYSPPIRNWAFDVTFTNPLRLPPGTPLFQHIEPTGFKQVL